ncbi:MAG: D-alanyl-D-alanine carboxypeptidase/D-alanyl-D-alanine-endopeptidase [Ilumatobacteraceae bacterium]
MDDLADRIVAAGVRTVTGDIVGDESRYDTRRFIPEWQEGIARVEGGPLSALLVNDGYDGDDWAEARATGNLPGDDPAAAAAAHLQRLLEACGVEIAGDAVSGVAPAGATSIARIESAPMAQIVTEMLTTSDNNTADLVVKEIGRVRMGEGSTTAGLRAERELFATWGLPVDQIEIFDGSGLSARNRVTCDFLIDLLDREADDPAFLAKLATAATSGTLRDAFVGTPAAGNLHAKTGTLSIARALSGYLIDDGEEVSFSLVVNGPGAAALAQPLWDELGQAADDVPSPISPQQLEP